MPLGRVQWSHQMVFTQPASTRCAGFFMEFTTMAHTTATERKSPPRTRRPKAEHLGMPYPDLPHTRHPHFWVAAYLIALTKVAALDHLRHKSSLKLDRVTEHALITASNHLLSDRAQKNLEYARDDGLLLYAWPGTTLFTPTTARH